LGIALNNYIAIDGHAPMGASPHVLLLPHLEQMQVYNSINLVWPRRGGLKNSDAETITGWLRRNNTADGIIISAYVCPSNMGDKAARLSYPGNAGDGFKQPDSQGVFGGGRTGAATTLASVTDGLGNTVAFAEWVAGEGRPDPLKHVYSPTVTLNREEFVSKCVNLDPATVAAWSLFGKGTTWTEFSYARGCYNHLQSINRLSCSNGGNMLTAAITAGSRHGDGAHVLFLDGRATFAKASTSPPVWHALGSVAGGESARLD